MKSRISLFVILIALLFFRIENLQHHAKADHKVTTWDAFGYYMYLPGFFIYHDVKDLKWVEHIDKKYAVTGGKFYQAIQLESGTYTNKYLCGVAILQMPWFFLGHTLAAVTNNPQDGFSCPYQYAIMFGAIFWAMLGLIFLRKVLLYYFSENVTAFTLLFLVLGSNLPQYISIDAAQSHVYIFSLYAVLLWLTIKWHENPTYISAALIGLICGLAVISRPTELIIIFLPILWGIHTKESAKMKWALVAANKGQLTMCIIMGLVAILPQLLYWKYTTGIFIFDVGSKWYFLNPWFRVLVGSEKGWFLYTPVALFMVAGLLFIKLYPFQKAVITFCLLNIWIIISWSDWRYGGSYSTRALTQSYPVFALALGSLIQLFFLKKKQLVLGIICLCLICLNVYQLYVYNYVSPDSFSPLLQFK
ncbi:MAG: hypothetical protein WC716_02060 [Chitinophagaceae bacterium]|jgi:hypothetical protein